MAGRRSLEGLMHAGAGTGLVLVQLSALIPGLLPSLALFGLLAAVVLLPLLALGLAAALLLAPAYGAWRLARRARRRARRPRVGRRVAPLESYRAGGAASTTIAKGWTR